MITTWDVLQKEQDHLQDHVGYMLCLGKVEALFYPAHAYFLLTQLTTKSLGRSLFKHLLKETLRKSVSILSLRMYVGMYSVVTLTNGDMSQLSTDHISFIGIP